MAARLVAVLLVQAAQEEEVTASQVHLRLLQIPVQPTQVVVGAALALPLLLAQTAAQAALALSFSRSTSHENLSTDGH